MPGMAPAIRPTDDHAFDTAPGDAARLDGVGRLHLTVPTRADLSRVVALLGSPEAPWLGEPVVGSTGPTREFACDLELPVGDLGPILFRKSAIIGLGAPVDQGASWLEPIEWRAATFKPLFPVFAGTLTILNDQLVLDGHYAPPGGRLGAVLDAALLKVAARGTGRWLLRTVAVALAA
jgi:hypothetical protein